MLKTQAKLKPVVSVKWLSQHLHDPNLIILDASLMDNKAGLKSEHEGFQIVNARFFDLKNTFCDPDHRISNMIPSAERFTTECRKLGINKNSKIVVYDNFGTYSSPRVWWLFKVMGHENIAVLNGGLPAWINEFCEVEIKESAEVELGDFQASFNSKRVLNAEQILENINTEHRLVIDVRTEDRFFGRVPEPRENLRGGHVPNSINLPFNRVLANGMFLSDKELSVLFKSLPLNNKSLVFCCGSGVSACIGLLACELVLENEKYLYDGSWAEWGQLENYPIE
ncbi:sulfurtransferase [Labilibaculum antarcticum]|uniref:Sulfurtransferase n=1 Tax=Labilibaculum antarcticum TaxID=1717717 RepID=A0A1Y1CMC5_9BACT|nr:sulfurtransferase [Labilibaculum antarcticum]BAX81173.1 sulfurtransferase [Labilibaculum antarcticum]